MNTLAAPAPPPTGVEPRSRRLFSLDAFRGATIVGMILVNNPGTWGAIYPPLKHAAWHGWTPTDLVFPFFLFIVGVAIALAYGRALEKGAGKPEMVRKAAVRALWLFGLGLMMAYYPFFSTDPLRVRSVEMLRIPGVLQRIAVCYFAASLLYLYARPRARWVWLWALLIGYWLAMALIPVPGVGAGHLDVPRDTLAAFVDRAVLGANHLWVGADREWDPEGFLSTLPAIASTLLGVWAGGVFGSERADETKALHLLLAGFALLVLGYVWNGVFPINKGLWTSSYTVFTGGMAMCFLAVFYWTMDLKGYRKWGQPFVEYGVNAITVFVMSGIVAKTLGAIKVTGADGSPTSLQSWIYHTVFAPIGPPEFSSLLYALTWITAWFLVLHVMYKRGVVIKV